MQMRHFRKLICAPLLLICQPLCIVMIASAQQSAAPSPTVGATQQSSDAQNRELTRRERKRQEQEALDKIDPRYRKWLQEDVVYIVTPVEKTTFLKLAQDSERDRFIDEFWKQRDQPPKTKEDTFKQEHYRRIAYANEHFASSKPGWRTDRGHIYIVYGPPDEIETHPHGVVQPSPEEGAGTYTAYPFEQWKYRHIEGLGDNLVLEFVDSCECGDYQLVLR
jgi:GWxTD domain-containing protein